MRGRSTAIGGQIPREQGVTLAPFSAFHLKTFTSVRGSTSKEEGIVTVDVTVVFQFDPCGWVLFSVHQQFQRFQMKELEIKEIASFFSHLRIVWDQTHASRYLAKEQIVFLETRLTLDNVVSLHITAF